MSMMDDRTPLLNDAPEATKEAPGHGQYGFWVCVCFTINYVIGVGILDIPYAFSQSGLVFGIVIALVSGGMILMTLVWVVEVMGRSMGWTAVLLAKSIDRRDNAVGQLERDPEHADTTPRDASVRALAAILQDKTPAQVLRETLEAPREEVQALLDAYDRSGSISSASINSGVTSDLLNPATEHQALIFEDGAPKKVGFDLCDPKVERAFEALGGKYYEINEMLDIFAPAWAKIGWEIALAMLLYLALWAYASVFGESVLAKFPIFAWSNGCGDDYSNACMWSFRLVVVIYGVIVVTLTCMEFTEMVWYQVAMTGARFGLIFLILFTCVIGLGTNPVDNGSTKEHAPYTQEFYTWEWSGLVPILSATVFAQLVLFGMPALLTPLKNKAQSVRVMVTASFTTTFFYILLGIFTVLYFGNTLKSPINKNYTDYSGGDRNGTRWWAYIIEYFCTLFPAVDVLSIFPLLGVALGNSLRAFAIRWSPWMKRKDAETKWVRIGCRLLAAIPPIFGSFILRDLSKILIYTSIPSLWLAFVGPVCLNYFSIRKCRMYGVDPNTPYTIKHLSGTPGMTVSIVFAVVCYILMVGNLISSSFPA